MKVCVLGSISETAPAEQRQKISTACMEIGKELAKQGHQIIVGSSNKATVDLYVVQGANQVKQQTTVFVFHPEGGERREPEPEKRELPFRDKEKSLVNIRIKHRPTSGTWHASHLRATQYADVVILLSGEKGTEVTGYYAFLLQKPLLPIPLFGGSAKELWNKYKNLYGVVRFSDDEIRYVFGEWGERSPSCISSALEKISSRNPFSKEARQSWLVTTGIGGAAVGLLVAWPITLSLGQNETLPRDACAIAIVVISALLGTTLRQVLRLINVKPAKIDLHLLVAEGTAGAILAFGFLLLFYLGIVAVTGAPISFTDYPNAGDATRAFRRLSFALSALAFGAALLLERAAQILAQRFSAAIGDHSSTRGGAAGQTSRKGRPDSPEG